MKNEPFNFIVLLTLSAILSLTPALSFGQTITVNRVYDFSQNANPMNSQFNFVYADSSRIFAMGEAHPQNADSFAFVAAFDYKGNIIWENRIHAPGGLITSASGFDNLKKVRPNLYVAGGNIVNAPKADSVTGAEPFLYFFDAHGDSVNFVVLTDSTRNEILTAMTVGDGGTVVACGSDSMAEDTLTASHEFWFSRVDSDGNILHQNQITFQQVYGVPYFLGFPDLRIVSIIPVSSDTPISWGSTRFLVACRGYPMGGGMLLSLSQQLDTSYLLQLFSGAAPLSTIYYGSVIISVEPSEFNFIPVKGRAHSFYWSLPCFYGTQQGTNFGIYYCRAQLNPYGPYFNNIYGLYNLYWEKALSVDSTHLPFTSFPISVQGRSVMASAANGDLLMEKESARQSDTTLPSYLPQSAYFLPALFRVDSNGQTRWAMNFQHVHTTDSNLYHSFNALSVAPNGRIVLAGYVNSEQSVPGYDTVGKVSWLLVLDDSVHDNDTTTGIALTNVEGNAQIAVYPNPTLNYTTLELQHFAGAVNEVSYQLCDLEGGVLLNGKFKTRRKSINLSNVASGVYFIRINYRGKVCGNIKLVKE